MKIICIAGHSCSGKSTALEFLRRFLPNSKTVSGDSFWLESLVHFAKEFEQIFGIPLDREKPGASLIRVECDPHTTTEKYRELFHLRAAFVEKQINKEINKAKEQGKDYIIVEYVLLPVLDVWKSADFRIMVTSKKSVRAEQLLVRFAKYGNPEDGARRSHNLREIVFGEVVDNAVDVDFVVQNNYDKTFERDLEKVCRKIIHFQ